LGALNDLGTVAGRRFVPRTCIADDGRSIRMLVALSVALAVGLIATLIAVWEPSQWRPMWLVAVLAVLTVVGELYAVRIGRVFVSSSTTALLLAIALLGPAPAVAIAGGSAAIDWAVNRKPLPQGIANVVIAAISTLVGAIAIDSFASPIDTAGGAFAGAVLAGGVAMVATNILLLGTYRQIHLSNSFRVALRVTYLPAFPFHLIGMTLAAGAAQIVVARDLPVVAAVATVVLADFLVRAVAADRSRLEEVMRLNVERTELLEGALTAEVAEREWIAGHVHDEALQTLAVARQDLDDALGEDREALVSAQRHLDTAIGELRRTLVHVHPASVHEHGLAASLDAYASQALRRGGATWAIDVQPGADERHQALLYSVAREFLSNAGKHARAEHVRLQLSRVRDGIRLVVEDDGVGFAPADAEASGHFGLLIARRRVAAAGGQTSFGSPPGGGARIEVELPSKP
jgi:signal transduction histidine kinase